MRLLSRKLGDPLRLGIDGERERDEWLVWGLALGLLWVERDRLRVRDLLLCELWPLELLVLAVWLWDLLRERDTEREPEWVLLRVRLRDADPLLLDDQLFALSRLEGLKPQLFMLASDWCTLLSFFNFNSNHTSHSTAVYSEKGHRKENMHYFSKT